jgi:hypothetical protein
VPSCATRSLNPRNHSRRNRESARTPDCGFLQRILNGTAPRLSACRSRPLLEYPLAPALTSHARRPIRLSPPPPRSARPQFGDTKPKPLNRSQLFVPADQVAQEEATEDQLQHEYPHAQGPYGVYPNDTWVAKLDYVTTSSKVAPMNVPDDPSSLASRIAHRRVARTKRNLNGGLFRPDPYDDSTVDDIAALDPRLKILQSRTEYRSEASKEMVTTSEQLFDMRDDGFAYSAMADGALQ